MPRMKFSGWDRLNTRWVKMLDGKRYRITCEELKLPKSEWTKEGSIDVAKKWWMQKLGELNSQEIKLPPLPEELGEYIEKLKRRGNILKAEGKNSTLYAERLKEVLRFVGEGNFDIPEIDPRVSKIVRNLSVVGGEDLLEGIGIQSLNTLFGENDFWQELEGKYQKIDQKQTIGYWLNEFEKRKFDQNNESTIIREKCFYDEILNFKLDGLTLLGKDMPIDCINEQKISEIYQAYKLMDLDPDTKKKRWGWFKKFVRYILEHAGHPPNRPRNLDSRDLVFSKRKFIVKPELNLKEIKTFIGKLPERLKMYALLALNCAMNNVDIALLEHRQIDFRRKTLKRKRIKTTGWDNVPTVTYYLWDETIELLKKTMNKNSEYVLTDSDGEILYSTVKKNGIATLYDKVGVQWRDYFRRNKNKKYTLKDFRFFSADLLGKSSLHMPYKNAFLGHSLKSVADTNYSSVNFDVINQCKYLERLFTQQTAKIKKGSR